MSAPITFLSDFGPGSDYVGICHAVIARIAPSAVVIDLAHDIPPGDVRAGAHVLARALPYTEPGVHLAVVDPGVGTDRRAVAVGSRGRRIFVGPDNGLLSAALAANGGASWARDVAESPYRVKPVSQTFHGRDIFAPVAAALAAGAEPDEVGAEIDPATLSEPFVPELTFDEGQILTRVACVDHFGNIVLEARWEDLVHAGLVTSGELEPNAVRVGIGRSEAAASIGAAPYDAVGPEAFLLHPDSFGSVELAKNGGSAAEDLDAAAGRRATIARRR